VAVVNLPLVYIFLRAGENGWAGWLETVWTFQSATLVCRSLALVVATVTAALGIALPAAWLVSRTDLPGRRLWATLMALPLVFPSYVAAFTMVAVLGPRGYLQNWLEPLGISRLPAFAYGFSGALLVLTLFTYPYVYLLLVATLRNLDPALEESARSLGASPWSTFTSVVLPQLRPSLFAGSLLIALYTLSDFGAVSIVRFNTFTLSIMNAYRGLFDRSAAASLATLLAIVALVLIATEAFFSRQTRPHRNRPSRPPPCIPLGRWRWPSLFALGALSTFTLGIPMGVVGFWGLRALLQGNSLGKVGNAVWCSLSVSISAALVATVLALPIAAWSVRGQGRWSRWVERLSYAGYALPGLVVALSFVFFTVRYARPLYQTVPLLVLAYVVRFLPEAMAPIRSAMAAIAPAFQEAARSLGRTQSQVLWSVTLPMILPGLLSGFALVFLTSMKELPATLLLRPTGFETLATEIWSHASEAIYSQAALPSLTLVLATTPPLYFLVIRPALGKRPNSET
jgi:iron(III) transport system permease protein